jgi:hypothetical protein
MVTKRTDPTLPIDAKGVFSSSAIWLIVQMLALSLASKSS